MRIVGRGQVRRADVEGARQARGLAHEREAAVVGDVEPLVPVGDDRVRAFDAVGEVPRTRVRGGRTGRTRRRRAASAVRPAAASAIAAIGSKSPALTSPALAITIAGPSSASSSLLERVEVEATDIVARSASGCWRGRSRASRSPAPRSGAGSRSTGSRAARRPASPSRSTSNPCCSAHQLRAAASADEVRHRRPGRRARRRTPRQLEQLAQPVDGDLLEPRRERRGGPAVGDLVVGRCEPVGAQRRGRAAAHHEVEEARPARPGGGRLARGRRARSAQRARRRRASGIGSLQLEMPCSAPAGSTGSWPIPSR